VRLPDWGAVSDSPVGRSGEVANGAYVVDAEK
jgi:hypothetical protein